MTILEIQEKIALLKKETDTAILAHSYQSREVIEVADYVGDSFKLSQDAKHTEKSRILMCGVRFMAETAKLLQPQKPLYLANENAGCPMAEQIAPEMLDYLRQKNPDRAVVAYINTTAELKTRCDVCVTSSGAVKIVKNMEAKKILFIPDCNLGAYIQNQVPEKDIKLVQGGCPVHSAVILEDVMKRKFAHPNALLLVHPECRPEVLSEADYVGSTSGIMNYAKNSPATEFIIGTEVSIASHLQYECPEKEFYILSKKILCPNMKITTLPDVCNRLAAIKSGEKACEIVLSDDTLVSAKKCIDEMLRLGS
jgi:quinolinate synthase